MSKLYSCAYVIVPVFDLFSPFLDVIPSPIMLHPPIPIPSPIHPPRRFSPSPRGVKPLHRRVVFEEIGVCQLKVDNGY